MGHDAKGPLTMAGTVKRIGSDRYRLRFTSDEITLLRSLPDQLRAVLASAGTESESSWDLPPDDLLDKAGTDEGEPTALGEQIPGAGELGTEDAAELGTEGTAKGAGDPVLERLFPQAYLEPEDEERDEEFHRLMRNDLLNEKLANLDVVTETLKRGTMSLRRWSVDISEDEAGAWLGALNDLRLALGVRLGITEDFDGDIDPSDPRAPALHILSYLGWLEENLVEALSSGW
jgi:hypothetical protein